MPKDLEITLADALRRIIDRLETEADAKHLEGKRPNWARAAKECVEEAYGALGMIDPYNPEHAHLLKGNDK